MPVWENKRFGPSLAVLLLLAGLVFAIKFLPLRDWLSFLSSWVKERGAFGVVVFMAIYIFCSVLLMPSAWFTAASAAAFGFWRGLLIAATSASIAAAISFLIARYFALKWVKRWVEKNERFSALYDVISERDWKIVLLCRLTPVVPFVLSNYFFGLTRLRFWPYFWASTVGIFPGAMLYAYVGYLGKVALAGENRSRTPQEYMFMAFGFVVTMLMVIYISRRARKALQREQNLSPAKK